MANAAFSGSLGLNTPTEAVQHPKSFPLFMRRLGAFLDGPLQWLNDAIEAGKSTLDDFLLAWEAYGRLMCRVAPLAPQMGERQARDLLRKLVFVPSSIEFHAQRAGLEPGAGLRQAKGMEETLIALGDAAHHTPRDSHDTLWRWNDGPDRIRFTGDVQENIFAEGVIQTDRVHTESCAMIRPVITENSAGHPSPVSTI